MAGEPVDQHISAVGGHQLGAGVARLFGPNMPDLPHAERFRSIRARMVRAARSHNSISTSGRSTGAGCRALDHRLDRLRAAQDRLGFECARWRAAAPGCAVMLGLAGLKSGLLCQRSLRSEWVDVDG